MLRNYIGFSCFRVFLYLLQGPICTKSPPNPHSSRVIHMFSCKSLLRVYNPVVSCCLVSPFCRVRQPAGVLNRYQPIPRGHAPDNRLTAKLSEFLRTPPDKHSLPPSGNRPPHPVRSSDKLAKAPLFLLLTDQSRPSLESPKPSTRVLTYFSPVQLCDPTDCSPPGSSVHGISQARVLEWVAISSSRGSS